MRRTPFISFGRLGKGVPLLGALLLLLLVTGARGQSALTSLSWDPSFPAGQTKDFIDKASWRSFGMDVKGFLTPRFTMGASFDWRLLNEVTDKIIEIEDGHASGAQTRRVYAIPLLLTSHYYFGSFKDYPNYIPYVGGGAGAYWIEEKLEIGVYTVQEKAWNFGLCVEIGTLFQFSYGYALVRFKYNYAFESEDVDPVSWWSVGIGLLDTH
jgi:hypothetical protein